MEKKGFQNSYKNTVLYFHENYITRENTNHSGMMLDKNPERDIDVRYKGKDYLLTISKIQ